MSNILRDHVADLKDEGVRCNCDLDAWEPERDTDHSWVCRIHRLAKARARAKPGEKLQIEGSI